MLRRDPRTVMDGLTFLAKKRQLDELSAIPVIIVSATARGPIDYGPFMAARLLPIILSLALALVGLSQPAESFQ
jgi:hypothetical protein